ncbi:MAG: hypothetical protein F6K62_10760 [Sphaerospermopsis sp. SIO1G2]|nr:hypothetical protein [Sphaerospermopsis sp. SIO1G2]
MLRKILSVVAAPAVFATFFFGNVTEARAAVVEEEAKVEVVEETVEKSTIMAQRHVTDSGSVDGGDTNGGNNGGGGHDDNGNTYYTTTTKKKVNIQDSYNTTNTNSGNTTTYGAGHGASLSQSGNNSNEVNIEGDFTLPNYPQPNHPLEIRLEDYSCQSQRDYVAPQAGYSQNSGAFVAIGGFLNLSEGFDCERYFSGVLKSREKRNAAHETRVQEVHSSFLRRKEIEDCVMLIKNGGFANFCIKWGFNPPNLVETPVGVPPVLQQQVTPTPIVPVYENPRDGEGPCAPGQETYIDEEGQRRSCG